MIHQPMSGMQGQVTEMEIALKETLKVRDELYQILADHSGQTLEKITQDSDRDYWMSATEAKVYGMIDDVLVKNPKAKTA
jgi:ATP-dependent Clp protease protease subunit